ncbi:MAG TPA: methylenetetrahydrofolate reductase, partial [candidate division Zixibacteria bacterium]|nr:methylenetetrahydrofolate reductase [candidate division Zixibacteria bacterium]
IDTVPHLLCRGFSREETEDACIELNYLGIHNFLAIRGDETNYIPPRPGHGTNGVNVYAAELVDQLMRLKSGKYLENLDEADPIGMCIGVAGYPEKHVESPNLKTDIAYLKKKVDGGAEYIVTQMFFDNRAFFNFVKECRAAGITVPIIPGLKILNSPKQTTSLPKNFHISIPDALVDEIASNDKHTKDIGVNWAIKQCEELLNGGVPCIHFYVMNGADSVINVIKKL